MMIDAAPPRVDYSDKRHDFTSPRIFAIYFWKDSWNGVFGASIRRWSVMITLYFWLSDL